MDYFKIQVPYNRASLSSAYEPIAVLAEIFLVFWKGMPNLFKEDVPFPKSHADVDARRNDLSEVVGQCPDIALHREVLCHRNVLQVIKKTTLVSTILSQTET